MRRKPVLRLLPVLALTLFCAGTSLRAAADAADLAARIDPIFQDFRPDGPGCAVGVMRDGALVFAKGYGLANLEHGTPITPKTAFYVGSVSKQFTAMTVAHLARQGKLSLDDDVRKHIPEVPDFGTPITARHLIHHTSGLREKWSLLGLSDWRDGDLVTLGDILDLIRRQKTLNFRPGDEHVYSNTGYDLLAILVERVTGKTLREAAQEAFFAPLGMKDTMFGDDRTRIIPRRAVAYGPREGGGFLIDMPNVETVGSGGLYTTVEDLALWEENFYTGRAGGKALMEQVQTPGTLNDGTRLEYAFGLGVDVHRGLKRVWHNGGLDGYRSLLIRAPEKYVSVAVLCNAGDASDPDTLGARVAEVVLADALAPEPSQAQATSAETVALPEKDLARVAGVYLDESEGLVRSLVVENGKLFYRRGPGNQVELAPLGLDRFLLRGVPVRAEVRVERGPDGAPVRMTLQADGQQDTVFRAMPPGGAGPVDLAELAGTYRSEELDSAWTLEARDGKLILHRRRHRNDTTLSVVFADGFMADDGGLVLFERGPDRRVTGLAVTVPGARNVRFVRMDPVRAPSGLQ
jgi:CubicO group peptidase (beta-lactamase class C family)